MKKIILLFFCTIALSVHAQISGKVTDERQQPLPGAGVQLYAGSKLLKVLLTNADGTFRITNQQGDRLVVNYVGYLADTIRTLKTELGTISLIPAVQTLGEVKIKNNQPVIRQETDRTVIMVNQQVLKLAANALEIINLAPGLSVTDQEDAILMSGKTEVQLMINDKLVKMTPRDIAKLLKAMPAGTVREVQVLANPPAKYEVNGNTGTINIKTNGVIKGFTGNIEYNTSQSKYNWSDLSSILNYGSGPFAVSAYLAWHSGKYLTTDLKTRQLSNAVLNQQTHNLDSWSDPVFRITADYQLNKQSTIGGSIEREASSNKDSYETQSKLDYLTGPDTGNQTNSQRPSVRHWNTYNINYSYSDRLGTELTVDLDRATYASDSQTEILNTGLPATIYNTLTHININTMKADYSNTWNNKLKLEAGFKLAGVQTHNDFNADGFLYREHINVLYISLNKIYDKWGWQLGMRAERTSSKGIANDAVGKEVIKPDSNYFNLLPSFYVVCTPTNLHHVRLTLSRRIKRPDYEDLQPFTYQVDPLDFKTGNPALLTEINDNAELSYTYNDKVTLISSYSRSGNYFNPLIFQAGNSLYQTTGNAGTRSGWNFDLNYPVRITKWWNMLNKANLGYDHFAGRLFQGFLDQGKWRYQFSSNQRFNLPGKYLLTLGARYTSAQQNLIYYQQSSANTTITFSHKLFADQASVKIGLSDAFKTQRNNTSVNFGQLQYTELGDFESRRVSFSFSWQFGNEKVRRTQNRERGDADEKARSGG